MDKPTKLINALSKDEIRRFLEIEGLARRLDEAFVIPGLKVKIGWDALIGLVPVVGDSVTGIFSLVLIWRAKRLGVPRQLLVRMGLNILIDWLVGNIPVLGDIFDVVYTANSRNLRLLEDYLVQTRLGPESQIEKKGS